MQFLRNVTCGVPTKFIVFKGQIYSPPLSTTNLTVLGMLQIREDGSFAKPNDLRISTIEGNIDAVTVNTEQPQIKESLGKQNGVFRGIGIRDVKKNEQLYVKFSMKPEAVPVAQKPHPIAYYPQKPLKAWLEQSIAEEIFEEIPPDEPITWCSPMVVQPKPKFLQVPKDELQPHMIRACVD